MARRKRRILRFVGWIVAGFFTLVFVTTLVFYLGRGWILERGLAWFNKNHPGEIRMEQINLIPLMDFPDVVLQLRNSTIYERKESPDSLYQEPISFLNEIYVSLDVVSLLRGDLEVSQFRLKDGFIRYEIYGDSVSNLERALAITFGNGPSPDTADTPSRNRIDVDRIELTNILALWEDHPGNNRANVRINQLESKLSYLPEKIEAELELNLDIDSVKYQSYSIESKDGVQFESQVSFDTEGKHLVILPSSLAISGLELQVNGNYNFLREPQVEVAFRAVNSGLDVLNYLFLGILDLDEISQIGAGSIFLEGTIQGGFGEGIPEVRVNGGAEDIGFRIKSINRDVTGISFNMQAGSGRRKDLSESHIHIRDFTATFPEGDITAEVRGSNMVSPEIDLFINGGLHLTGIDQMLGIEEIRGLHGRLDLYGNVHGSMERETGRFLNDAGDLRARLENVGFIVGQDSVSALSGELFLFNDTTGAQDLEFVFNGDRINLELKVENMVHYLLGGERDIIAELSVSSDAIHPGRITGDTALSGMLGEELKGLHFIAGAAVSKEELDLFLQEGSIPEAVITLDSFGLELPVYADVSDLRTGLTFGEDTLDLHYLEGTIGESRFSFAGRVTNFGSLMNRDSGAVVEMDYRLESDLMRAEDFFTVNGEFLLPETYKTEFLEDLLLDGTLKVPVEGMVYDSISFDFGLQINELDWNFRYYPMAFRNFNILMEKSGNDLAVERFRGEIGESDFNMSAMLGNIGDSLIQNMYGYLDLESSLLDFNELMNYQLPEEVKDTTLADTSAIREPPNLDQIDYPDFSFTVDIGELRYDNYKIFGLEGKLRSTREKVFHLDKLVTSAESGGTIGFNGQLNLAVPDNYYFSAELDLEEVNVNDLDFEMKSGDTTYTLKENFAGFVSANGIAEIYFTPDFKMDMAATTAMFNVEVREGALINFTPLQAAAKYLDNKDLNNVRFSTLRNNFTLMDSKVDIPLMAVESTAGLMLIEGEQRFDNSYTYLLRVPVKLVREAAVSAISAESGEEKEDEIQKMKMGKFMVLTLWNDGTESGVMTGDKRDKIEQ